jgi:hypothetical protein
MIFFITQSCEDYPYLSIPPARISIRMSASSHIPAAAHAETQSSANAHMRQGAGGISLPAVTAALPAMPIQLKKAHAQAVIDSHRLAIEATRDAVGRYVHDTGNPFAIRRQLLDAWNKNQLTTNCIPMPADLAPSSAGTAMDTDSRLTRADSYADFGQAQLPYDFSGRDMRALGTKAATATTDVPVVTSVAEAARLVRAFGAGMNRGGTGPQFILQLGSHMGLFEARRENDLVYVPLHSSASALMRSGDIFDWSAHARALKAAFGDMAKVKAIIVATLQGSMVPDSELVMSTVGAMLCDAKTSISGFLAFLDTFEASAETDPTRLFSSRPDDKPVWGPSVKGGRALPAEKREEVLAMGYLPNDAQQTALRQLGLRMQWVEPDGRCVFGALGTILGAPAAGVMERLLGILQSDPKSEQLQAALTNAAMAGVSLDLIIDCIMRNDWARPGAGDMILEIAAVAFGIGLTVLWPTGAVTHINGGGKVLVKVTNPLEHFHSTL